MLYPTHASAAKLVASRDRHLSWGYDLRGIHTAKLIALRECLIKLSCFIYPERMKRYIVISL